MSALHVYVLKCDAPTCDVHFARNLARADQTRQAARELGWVHGIVPPGPHQGGPAKSLDYCPTHAELGADLVAKPLPMHAREVRT